MTGVTSRPYAALVTLLHRYLSGMLDPSVTQREVHKLLYFMQEAGEPLGLTYQQSPYGPIAENLHEFLRPMDGPPVSWVDADTGYTPLQFVPGAIEDAASVLAQYPDTTARLQRVAKLIDGFESPFGLMLLSSVHWIMNHKTVNSVDDVIRHANTGTTQFTMRQIAIAVHALSRNGWVGQFVAY